MRWLTTTAAVIVSALMWPTAASAYSFGDWASDNFYSPDDVMPDRVNARMSSIDSLSGIGDLDWITRLTTELILSRNQLKSIEASDRVRAHGKWEESLQHKEFQS